MCNYVFPVKVSLRIPNENIAHEYVCMYAVHASIVLEI